MKAQDALKSLRTQEDKQQENKFSEWGRCDFHGCPLQISVKATKNTCSYHFNMFGYEAEKMTESIKDNQGLIKKWAEMVYWTPRDWKQRKPQLLGWHVLPMGSDEPNSVYLHRFKKWVDEQIKLKCSELIEHGM